MKINFKRTEGNSTSFINLIEKKKISPVTALSLMEDSNKITKKQSHQKPDKERIRSILDELDSLIGLYSVKRLIKEINAFVQIQKLRKQEHLASEPTVLHMIFKGNPGTGKTTVARIIGRLFRELGVLQKGHILEIERADLVGEYIGHTAQKTKDIIKNAIGGVLFIDEAYSLARGGEKDFGKEAIDTLVKAMEDNKDNLILVLAGYQNEMDWFLETNPGLRSRFPIHLDFEDYTYKELTSIAQLMLTKRQYKLSDDANNQLGKLLMRQNQSSNAGNARLVRNIIEKAIRKQAVRLISKPTVTREELMIITKEDLEIF